MMADDEMNPDEINAWFDEAGDWTEEQAANVVPFKPKGEAKARARPDLPVITLEAGELHNIATEAEAALIASGTPFYVRSQKVMRPVVDVLPASHNRMTKVARLAEVGEATMIDRLSRSAVWLKWDGRAKKMVPADPTPKVSATVLSRDGEWTFPRLAGVITTPTLRPDGTILSEPGYDPATQLLLLDPPEMPTLPPRPSKKVAEKALARLDSLLNEFPFVDDASRSVALSALITPVVRGALMVAPMHITKAPVAGSGKSYIIDIASAINSGEKAPVMSAGAKEEELEKRLTSALLAGQTFISIDNVNGELGGDFLCQVVERPIVQPRILGKSETPKIENRSSCFATGNNIRLVGDMTRRVVICSLDPGMERPETREFSGDPFDAVLANRGLYVAAALTVVRAYVVAGCPGVLPALASFEDWSRLVRSALVWLGRADPLLTMEQAREDDPTTSTLRQVYHGWHDAVGQQPHTASEMIAKSNLRGVHNDLIHEGLHDAFTIIANDRAGGLTPTKLGQYLKRHENRIIGPFKVVSAGKSRTDIVLWKVVKL
jgi:putative DNA primase/helicase